MKIYIFLFIFFISFSSDVYSKAPITVDKYRTPVYENITEIRDSYIPPSFNGASDNIMSMITECVWKAWRNRTVYYEYLTGQTIIQFIIDKTGQTQKPVLQKSTWAVGDSQTIDYISQFPKLIPGSLNGNPIDTQVTATIDWDMGRAYYDFKPIFDSSIIMDKQ